MATPSRPEGGGYGIDRGLRASPPDVVAYQRVGPPAWLLGVAVVVFAASAALLAQTSFIPSVYGLVLNFVALAVISAYRYVLIMRESHPEFVRQEWQTKVAQVVLGLNFLLSLGHAYYIALEVGKRWV